jgi:hypothetical protein
MVRSLPPLNAIHPTDEQRNWSNHPSHMRLVDEYWFINPTCGLQNLQFYGLTLLRTYGLVKSGTLSSYTSLHMCWCPVQLACTGSRGLIEW